MSYHKYPHLNSLTAELSIISGCSHCIDVFVVCSHFIQPLESGKRVYRGHVEIFNVWKLKSLFIIIYRTVSNPTLIICHYTLEIMISWLLQSNEMDFRVSHKRKHHFSIRRSHLCVRWTLIPAHILCSLERNMSAYKLTLHVNSGRNQDRFCVVLKDKCSFHRFQSTPISCNVAANLPNIEKEINQVCVFEFVAFWLLEGCNENVKLVLYATGNVIYIFLTI